MKLAILIELPKGTADIPAVRRMLKCLLRSFGLKCLAVARPDETATFKDDRRAEP